MWVVPPCPLVFSLRSLPAEPHVCPVGSHCQRTRLQRRTDIPSTPLTPKAHYRVRKCLQLDLVLRLLTMPIPYIQLNINFNIKLISTQFFPVSRFAGIHIKTLHIIHSFTPCMLREKPISLYLAVGIWVKLLRLMSNLCCPLLGYNPVRTSQETHYVSTTESSRLMLYKI
jgi:hypothetical protein